MADTDWLRSGATNVTELLAEAESWAKGAFARRAAVCLAVLPSARPASDSEWGKDVASILRGGFVALSGSGYVWTAGVPSVALQLPESRGEAPWPLEEHAAAGVYVSVVLPVLSGAHPAGTTDDEWTALDSVLRSLAAAAPSCLVFAVHSEDSNFVASEMADVLPEWLTGAGEGDDFRLCLRPAAAPGTEAASVVLVGPDTLAGAVGPGDVAASLSATGRGPAPGLTNLFSERLSVRLASSREGQGEAALLVPAGLVAAVSAPSSRLAVSCLLRFLGRDEEEARRAGRVGPGPLAAAVADEAAGVRPVRARLPRALEAAAAGARWSAPKKWAAWASAGSALAGSADPGEVSRASDLGSRLVLGLGLLCGDEGRDGDEARAAAAGIAAGGAALGAGAAPRSGAWPGMAEAWSAARVPAASAPEAGAAALDRLMSEGEVPGREAAGAEAVRGVLGRVPAFMEALSRGDGAEAGGAAEAAEAGDGGGERAGQGGAAGGRGGGGEGGAEAEAEARAVGEWASWIERGGPTPGGAELCPDAEGGAAEVLVPSCAGSALPSVRQLLSLMALRMADDDDGGGDGDGDEDVDDGRVTEEDDAMAAELSGTTLDEMLDRVALRPGEGEAPSAEATLVSALARSVSAQAGASGPAAALLGQLGVRQPAEWLAGAADEDA